MLRTLLVYTCCPLMIIHGILSHSLKCAAWIIKYIIKLLPTLPWFLYMVWGRAQFHFVSCEYMRLSQHFLLLRTIVTSQQCCLRLGLILAPLVPFGDLFVSVPAFLPPLKVASCSLKKQIVPSWSLPRMSCPFTFPHKS